MIQQYYYKMDDCPATNASDRDCICWHEAGSGPMPEGARCWREKPNTPPEQPKPVIPDGWKLVPVEPTDTMQQEAYNQVLFELLPYRQDTLEDIAGQIYRAMLAAAPKPE